jgi:hypothetical protein
MTSGACTNWSRGMLKLIAPQTHGVIDLLMSVALIASPFVFGFYDDDETAMAFFLVMGIGAIVIGLATRFVPDEGTVARNERATRAA